MYMSKFEKGDHLRLTAKIVKVWESGLLTLHLRGYEHPVSIHEKYLDDVEIVRRPKEPKARNRRKPLYDKPT
ncbi:hypothetical protein SJ05684_c21550 [Sinorhizobium sojae CCBAU 05684]|uniref:Uncharacterized protein n=2 Tax=Sinorhizobium sojae TaxID=716925 RepID=A0A249PCP1_9HYPH|nr:hypothetical protein SJ05684_c21550 [Sinorhizobium sojae CCBAU 05684]